MEIAYGKIEATEATLIRVTARGFAAIGDLACATRPVLPGASENHPTPT